MWPGLTYLWQLDTDIPDWILLLGIFISTIFALLMIYFARKSSVRARSLDTAFTYIVYALARATEANDAETGNHIFRVGEFCALIAKNLGMSKQFINDIRIQSALHDIGKIHIPSQILRKPEAFTSNEWEIMKTHTAYGAVIIGDHPRLRIGKNIALTHHERWDGSGYPCGLKDEAIPLEGQIISIADEYDALRSPRYYKPAYDHKTAYKIITEGDAKVKTERFSPRVLKAFKEVATEFEETYERLRSIDVAKELEVNFCHMQSAPIPGAK